MSKQRGPAAPDGPSGCRRKRQGEGISRFESHWLVGQAAHLPFRINSSRDADRHFLALTAEVENPVQIRARQLPKCPIDGRKRNHSLDY